MARSGSDIAKLKSAIESFCEFWLGNASWAPGPSQNALIATHLLKWRPPDPRTSPTKEEERRSVFLAMFRELVWRPRPELKSKDERYFAALSVVLAGESEKKISTYHGYLMKHHYPEMVRETEAQALEEWERLGGQESALDATVSTTAEFDASLIRKKKPSFQQFALDQEARFLDLPLREALSRYESEYPPQ